MKMFLYQDELYLRVVPGKNLFRSSLVHDVVNRGDIFAVRCSDQQLTVIKGTSQVQHLEGTVQTILPLDDVEELRKQLLAHAKLTRKAKR